MDEIEEIIRNQKSKSLTIEYIEITLVMLVHGYNIQILITKFPISSKNRDDKMMINYLEW